MLDVELEHVEVSWVAGVRGEHVVSAVVAPAAGGVDDGRSVGERAETLVRGPEVEQGELPVLVPTGVDRGHGPGARRRGLDPPDPFGGGEKSAAGAAFGPDAPD